MKRVVIEGNMASGKSLWATALAKMLDVPLLSMDKCREAIWYANDATPKQRENEAQMMMLNLLESGGSYVLERIGTGKFDAAMDHVIGAVDMRVLVDARPAVCVRRFENRGPKKSGIILPDYMRRPEDFIYKTADRLRHRREAGKYDVVLDNGQQLLGADFKVHLKGLWQEWEVRVN